MSRNAALSVGRALLPVAIEDGQECPSYVFHAKLHLYRGGFTPPYLAACKWHTTIDEQGHPPLAIVGTVLELVENRRWTGDVFLIFFCSTTWTFASLWVFRALGYRLITRKATG